MNITAGIYKGQKVVAPDEKIVRPTLSKAREGIFNVLYSLVDFEECSFLDMYAGSGIMGLEALSRGFKQVVSVEKNISVVRIIKENYKKIGLEPMLYVGDSLKVLNRFSEKFDVIFVDPPYYSGVYEKSLEVIRDKRLCNGVVVLEHVTEIQPDDFGFEVIKTKVYSNKSVTFVKVK